MGTAFFQVLATFGCNSINHVSQSESRIQILLQFDWTAQLWLLQPDVAETWQNSTTPLTGRGSKLGSWPWAREVVLCYVNNNLSTSWLSTQEDMHPKFTHWYSIHVKCSVCASFKPSTATSWWLPVKWHLFRVTFGYQRSHDVISCHVSASYCKQKICREWNVQYTRFKPSTATSRWLPVKWRHLRVTSGHMRSRDVISCHVIASYCELHHCMKWNVQYSKL